MKRFKNKENISFQLARDTSDEIEKLLEGYKKEPDILIRYFDDMVTESILGIIANFRVNHILREDMIANVEALLRIRETISYQYSDNSSK